MLKKFFVVYFMFCSSLLASDKKNIVPDLDKKGPTVKIFSSFAPREKSADEIIADAQAKGQIEFLGLTEWLRKERPHFTEAGVSAHPLFPLLREAMALADFEVDTLTGFLHTFMETNMVNEQVESMIELRQNAGNAKMLVRYLIDCIGGVLTPEGLIENLLQSRLENIVEYQANVMSRVVRSGDMSRVKPTRMGRNVPHYDEVEAGFLRSYNTKNKILRALLDFLKAKNSGALIEHLPKKIIDLIILSPSLHPFLNRENDDWLDYDVALNMGEARNFLGNAAELGIDLRQFFQQNKIQGVRRPKPYKSLSKFSIPAFLNAKKKEFKYVSLPMGILPAPTDEERLAFGIARIEEIAKSLTQDHTISGAMAPQPSISPSISGDISARLRQLAQQLAPLPISTNATAAVSVSSLASASSSAGALVSAPSSVSDGASVTIAATDTTQPKAPAKDEEKTFGNKSTSAATTASIPLAAAKTIHRDDAHAGTIYDIFRPKGYTCLNDSKVIAAWNHVLKGRGYHKDNTGRSHQPLCAELSDGTRVVLGLFRSSGYGPNYVRYIREAFQAIGYGREWLSSLGYKL